MSAAGATDNSISKSAVKKKRKNNKKKANDKSKDADGEAVVNGSKEDVDLDDDNGEADEDGAQQLERKTSVTEQEQPVASLPASEAPEPETAPSHSLPVRNGAQDKETPPSKDSETVSQHDVDDATGSDTTARLEAMAKERDDLRSEVAELRKSLEEIQEKHQEELSGLRGEVEDAQSARENAESQYRTLLGKVNTIRSQLGERLKADAEELSQARTQIEELQEQNSSIQESNDDLRSTIAKLDAERNAQADEIASLRSRTNISQSNWLKERDELISREAFAREEFESAKQAMQDWEVLAMEERSLRENLSDRVAELEDQLNAQRELYERVAGERDGQNQTIDGLQRALHDIQDARKRELREMVESSQSQLDALRTEAESAKTAASTSAAELEAVRKELERALPFEKEVKEKNLLIGKLRHEAVILNDHLTKALRFLKRGKPEDNVDRQIVTNHFLHFLMLDRSDPKKFQVLQLIAALLGWTEEQREQAGLARPGASTNSTLRVPLSPFRRTLSLSSDFMPESSGGSRESLAELWSEFLEREAQEGGGGSRAGSVVGTRTPSIASPTSERQGPGFGMHKIGSNAP